MEDLRAFVRKVWIWKSAGITLWGSLYLSLHILFGAVVVTELEMSRHLWAVPLSVMTDILAVFLYIRCLTIVPVRYVVLSLDEVLRRVYFFAAAFAAFFMNIFATGSVTLAFYEAILMTVMLAIHLDFAIPLADGATSRKDQMAKEYRPPLVSYCVILLLYVYVGPVQVLIGVSLFRLATMTFCLCAVVCSERTSFAQKHSCERLALGLNSRSNLVRYWAYSDILDVARDPSPRRRKFLFDDDAERFKDVAHRLIELIDSFTLKNRELGEKSLDRAAAHKVASPEWRRGVVRGRLPFETVDRVEVDSDSDEGVATADDDTGLKAEILAFLVRHLERVLPYGAVAGGLEHYHRFVSQLRPRSRYFAAWLKLYWRRFVVWKATRKDRMAKEDIERIAVQNGVLVDHAIEVIIQLINVPSEEDRIGVIPIMAETFLDTLLKLRRALGNSSGRGFVSPPFAVPWAYASYGDIVDGVRRSADKAIEEMLTKYGNELDTKLLSSANREFCERFVEVRPKDEQVYEVAVQEAPRNRGGLITSTALYLRSLFERSKGLVKFLLYGCD